MCTEIAKQRGTSHCRSGYSLFVFGDVYLEDLVGADRIEAYPAPRDSCRYSRGFLECLEACMNHTDVYRMGFVSKLGS